MPHKSESSASHSPRNPIPVDQVVHEKLTRAAYARAATARRVTERLEELHRWAQTKLDKTWKLYGQTWEEWAEPNLGYSYKHIDDAIAAREVIGDALLRILMEFDVQKQQVRALCHAVTRAGLQIEGTVIRDGALVLDVATDTAGALEYIERLHTAREAKKREAQEARRESKYAKEQLARQQEVSENREAKLHELLEAKDKKIAHYEMTPESTSLGTEADARVWPHLKDWQEEMEVRLLQVDTMIDQEGHSAGLWYELGTLIGWMQEELYQRGKALLLSRGGEYMEFARLEKRPEVQLPPGRWPERTETAMAERALAEAEARGITNGHGAVLSLVERTIDNTRTPTSR